MSPVPTSHTASAAMNGYLSNIESLVAALSVRQFSADQWQRLGRIIAAADDLARGHAADPQRLDAKAKAMGTAAFTLHELRCRYPKDGCSCSAVVVR